MDILQEFLGPIPLAALVLVVFVIIMIWMISKYFKLPEDFATKEMVREEIRYRLFDQAMQAQEIKNEDDSGQNPDNPENADGTKKESGD